MDGIALLLVLALAAPADSAAPPRGAFRPPSPASVRTLSAFDLRIVRLHADGRPYVLREPVFEPAGVSWRSADGHTRPRPGIVAGEEGDRVPPPPNPVPWERVERLEKLRPVEGFGSAVGLLGGGLAGYLATALTLADSDLSLGASQGWMLAGAVAGGLAGRALGHAMLDPDPEWQPIYLAEPAAGATATDAARSATAGAPPDTMLRRFSVLGLRRARVTIAGRPRVMNAPFFGADGLGWESVEGFPRPRPAVFVGSDWDSVRPPPNPVPWERVERLEFPRANPASGATKGAILAGVLLGIPAIGLGAALDTYTHGDTDGGGIKLGFGVALIATVAGAVLGHALWPPSYRWTPAPWPPAAADSASAAPAPARRR